MTLTKLAYITREQGQAFLNVVHEDTFLKFAISDLAEIRLLETVSESVCAGVRERASTKGE